MDALAGLFPPGTDLCQIPIGVPPHGQAPDFNDVGLRSLTIAFSVILTAIAITFAFGRLCANIRKLGLSDLFVLFAAIANIIYAVFLIVYARYNRHQWNLPLCWINGQYELVAYIYESLTCLSLFFSKTATLLLFRQVFNVSRAMLIAIWIGIAVSFTLYGSSLAALSYFSAPHAGQTWDQVAAEAISNNLSPLYKGVAPIVIPLYWGVAQGAIGTVFDLYIFILPLPILSRLNLSRKRKLQLSALFFVAILGVVGSVVSLAYRVVSISGPTPDLTYSAGVLLNCNLIEMNIALVVCSTPAFANFMRNHVMQSRIFKSLRSTLGGSSSGPILSRISLNPNRPRTGHDAAPKRNRLGGKDAAGYIDISDTLLLKSGVTVDIEATQAIDTPNSDDSRGLKVVKTVDVEHSPAPSASSTTMSEEKRGGEKG
ncbi:hypothetical protein F5Y10DRAFT_263118 [Nemania abortiva]|nr:hypothetical protein F5Y10DRAFT_263118 [Nemania abortiva]